MCSRSPENDLTLDGVLLVDKEEGESSFSTVRKVKRILGVKKAGHAGTLDPFATGLLVVLLGEATKLSSFLMAGRKRYVATLRLGSETDTLDRTGRVVRTRPVPILAPEEVREKMSLFLGETTQVPPAFSAVKHKGRRAYELARKGIFPALKKRTVIIHRLDMLSLGLPGLTLLVECSGGTYIRSLAADLGEALGTGAHLTSLRRIASGALSVDEAVSMAGLVGESAGAVLKKKMISLNESLEDVREYPLSGEAARKIRNGNQIGLDELGDRRTLCEGWLRLVKGQELVAMAEVRKSSAVVDKRVRILRVFTR
ncbi:MAG: tRNA pseudouridine(55) synthase TruB [Deltaproteobacteria bacterium]|nr:tRNA pseudouridine(55) synthase TruB [Deltaproteobacteria bacterium]